MIVQSPLRKRETRPNLRRVHKPNVESPTPSHTSKRTATKVKSSSVKSRIQDIKPWKVILASVIAGVFGFMYLTHVFATQSLLEEVQILEVEFNKARSKHDALKLQYDKMVGPADIYRNAEQAGFVNGGPADKVITIKD
tara:strand:- start:14103 stop:14519 length:417 start_codon:yes stop_codon:yes gene_type:complete